MNGLGLRFQRERPVELIIPKSPSRDQVCKNNRERNFEGNVVKRMTQDIHRRKMIKDMNSAFSTVSLKKVKKKSDVFDRLVQDTNARTGRKVRIKEYLVTKNSVTTKFSMEDVRVYDRLYKDSEMRKERRVISEQFKEILSNLKSKTFSAEYKITDFKTKEEGINSQTVKDQKQITPEKNLNNETFSTILYNSQETLEKSAMSKIHTNLISDKFHKDRKKLISILKFPEDSIDEATQTEFNEEDFIAQTYGHDSKFLNLR